MAGAGETIEWLDGHLLEPRQSREIKHHLQDDNVLLVNNGVDQEVVRISAAGSHRQTVALGTQLTVKLNPVTQEGPLALEVHQKGAVFLVRQDHTHPSIPTVRFCAVIQKGDDWKNKRLSEVFESSFPYRRVSSPVVNPDVFSLTPPEVNPGTVPTLVSRRTWWSLADVKIYIRRKVESISIPMIGFSSWIYAAIFYRTGVVFHLITVPVILTALTYVQEVFSSAVAGIPTFSEVKHAFEYALGMCFGIALSLGFGWMVKWWFFRVVQSSDAVNTPESSSLSTPSPGIEVQIPSEELSDRHPLSPKARRTSLLEEKWEESQPNTPVRKESVSFLSLGGLHLCEASSVFMVGEHTTPLMVGTCKTPAILKESIMDGDILFHSDEKRNGDLPRTMFLCHEHLELYKTWAISIKCQQEHCDAKGFLWPGVIQTKRLCAIHFRSTVVEEVTTSREPKENIVVPVPEVDNQPDKRESETRNRDLQFGEFARRNQEWQTHIAETLQTTLSNYLKKNQDKELENDGNQVSHETKERVEGDNRDKPSESEGTASSSGAKKRVRTPSRAGTRTSDTSEESDNSVEWENLKRTFGKQKPESLGSRKSAMKNNEDDSKSVASDCLQRCAKRESELKEGEHQPTRDLLMTLAGSNVDGVRNKSFLPKFLQKPQPRGLKCLYRLDRKRKHGR